jgi:hypothetical protein
VPNEWQQKQNDPYAVGREDVAAEKQQDEKSRNKD